MKQKLPVIIIGLLLVFSLSTFLYQRSLKKPLYEGLPTVACIDTTEPVATRFTFSLQISINGKTYPLDKTIGHDAGNCLHNIYVNDASGTVYVQSNDTKPFTLGQFFDEWHKPFSDTQILSYPTDKDHEIHVYVNDARVLTKRDTLLSPNTNIRVAYE